MRQLYEADVGGASDPQQEDERKRAELVRRRANLSRQHELGLIDDTQLVSRMGEIRQEEARIPPPGSQRRVRWDQTLEAIKALESLGAQWREASIAGEDGLCHRMAFALVDTIYFDLCQQRIVGVGPKGDIALPVKKRLEEHGWYEREPGVLWKDQPDELSIGGIRTRYDEVADALRDGVVTVQEMADRLGMGYKQIHAYLRRMIREGDAISEQVPDAGRKHLRFRHVGSIRQAPEEPRLLPLPVWQEE